MLIRFLVFSIIKYNITVRTIFCPHARDSEPGSVFSLCVSHTTHNQTGLVGEKCSQKGEGPIFVIRENVVGKTCGVTHRVSGVDRAPEIKLYCLLCLNIEEDNWEWGSDSPGAKWLMDGSPEGRDVRMARFHFRVSFFKNLDLQGNQHNCFFN